MCEREKEREIREEGELEKKNSAGTRRYETIGHGVHVLPSTVAAMRKGNLPKGSCLGMAIDSGL